LVTFSVSLAAPGLLNQKSKMALFLKKFRGYVERNAARAVFKRPLEIRTERPLISFTFDDFPRSALLAGGAILNHYGVAGTYYAALSLLGKVDEPSGRTCTLDDLHTALEKGHELGSHTFSHCHSWKTETQVFEESIRENGVALQRLLPGAEFRTFSYPISEPRPLTKRQAGKYFRACRAGGQTLNTVTADLNQLSAFFLEKSRDRIQVVKDLIDVSRNARGWIIFATHDVVDDPSPYGCTPKFFEEVVQYAVNSGASVLPVVSALEILTNTKVGEMTA
jgi:peptidoglycan/xylan/chitin deacetylase (PgdA/CDA1 family)